MSPSVRLLPTASPHYLSERPRYPLTKRKPTVSTYVINSAIFDESGICRYFSVAIPIALCQNSAGMWPILEGPTAVWCHQWRWAFKPSLSYAYAYYIHLFLWWLKKPQKMRHSLLLSPWLALHQFFMLKISENTNISAKEEGQDLSSYQNFLWPSPLFAVGLDFPMVLTACEVLLKKSLVLFGIHLSFKSKNYWQVCLWETREVVRPNFQVSQRSTEEKNFNLILLFTFHKDTLETR